jgi:hypothetical protein
VAEPFVFESHSAHRSIFPATTKCLAFALFRPALKFSWKGCCHRVCRLAFPVLVSTRAQFRGLLLHCNILLTCLLRGTNKRFARQAATNASVAADARADPSSAKEINMAETNEDPLAAAGEDPMVETASVTETRKALVVETREDSVAETREDHPVVVDFENLQNLGNGGAEAAASAAGSFTGSFQMFAAEATDYSRKSLESGSAFIENLRRAKSLESAIQIQSDYAKSAYAEFVAYLVKMSDLYCNLFKRGSTLIEKAAAKIEGVKS